MDSYQYDEAIAENYSNQASILCVCGACICVWSGWVLFGSSPIVDVCVQQRPTVFACTFYIVTNTLLCVALLTCSWCTLFSTMSWPRPGRYAFLRSTGDQEHTHTHTQCTLVWCTHTETYLYWYSDLDSKFCVKILHKKPVPILIRPAFG